ncbi:9506_t:CDS:2, partial [Ambispora gerdemannii]
MVSNPILHTDESSISTYSYGKVRILTSFIIQFAHKQPLKIYYGLGMYVIHPMVMVAEEAIFQEQP